MSMARITTIIGPMRLTARKSLEKKQYSIIGKKLNSRTHERHQDDKNLDAFFIIP
jgi:hypothetical protein